MVIFGVSGKKIPVVLHILMPPDSHVKLCKKGNFTSKSLCYQSVLSLQPPSLTPFGGHPYTTSRFKTASFNRKTHLFSSTKKHINALNKSKGTFSQGCGESLNDNDQPILPNENNSTQVDLYSFVASSSHIWLHTSTFGMGESNSQIAPTQTCQKPKTWSAWCSTPTLLLICTSFRRANDHPLLICSSLSTAKNIILFRKKVAVVFVSISRNWIILDVQHCCCCSNRLLLSNYIPTSRLDNSVMASSMRTWSFRGGVYLGQGIGQPIPGIFRSCTFPVNFTKFSFKGPCFHMFVYGFLPLRSVSFHILFSQVSWELSVRLWTVWTLDQDAFCWPIDERQKLPSDPSSWEKWPMPGSGLILRILGDDFLPSMPSVHQVFVHPQLFHQQNLLTRHGVHWKLHILRAVEEIHHWWSDELHKSSAVS